MILFRDPFTDKRLYPWAKEQYARNNNGKSNGPGAQPYCQELVCKTYIHAYQRKRDNAGIDKTHYYSEGNSLFHIFILDHLVYF